MLKTVVGDAYEPYAQRDRRVPSPVDDAVKLARRQADEQRTGAIIDGVEVVQEHLRSVRPNRRNVRGRVAVPGIRWVGFQSASWCPIAADPQLIGVEDLRDVVVLDSGEMPNQPTDGIRIRRRRHGEFGSAEPVHRRSRQRWDAAEEFEKERINVHTASSA